MNTHALWTILFVKSILHKLFILHEFNLFRILGHFWKLQSNITLNLNLEFFINFDLLKHCFFLVHTFGGKFLPTGINYLNNNINDSHNGGYNGKIETTHSDINHGLLIIVIEIVEQNHNLDRNNTDIVNESNYYLHLTLIGTRNHKIHLKCQMQTVQKNEQVDLHKPWKDT